MVWRFLECVQRAVQLVLLGCEVVSDEAMQHIELAVRLAASLW